MQTYLSSLSQRSARTFWDLVKIMVPIMILVKIASDLGAIEAAAPYLAPLMALVGLPAEAAIVWTAALLLGIYGGIAALPALAGQDLSVAQISILCSMMLIAHALPLEQAIVKKAGASFWGTCALRFFTALLYGALVAWFSKLTGLFAKPADLGFLDALLTPNPTWFEWLLSSVSSLAFMLVVLISLLVLLDVLNALGITRFITRLLNPMLKVSGLNEKTAPVTTVGVLLGLTYGSGLIIDQARDASIPENMRILSLCWISLSHALIEDTALMYAIGGDLWIILVGRLLITLLTIRLIAVFLQIFNPPAQPSAGFA